MGIADRDYYPPGDLRVSDAERDRALSELSEALQAGRITASEFDQRSGQVLGARTGKELTVPLADLPPVRHAPAVRATAMERPQRIRAPRIVIGASVAATCFAAAAVSAAISSGPTLAQREWLQAMAARQGLSVPLPPAQGFNWAGTITPGVIAVLLVVLIVFLSVTRIDRPAGRSNRGSGTPVRLAIGGCFQAVQEAVEDRAHGVAGGGAVVGAGYVEA